MYESNKSAIGHLLEQLALLRQYFLKSIQTEILPPTLNLENPDTNSSINLIPHEPIKKSIKNVISNSLVLEAQTQV